MICQASGLSDFLGLRFLEEESDEGIGSLIPSSRLFLLSLLTVNPLQVWPLSMHQPCQTASLRR